MSANFNNVANWTPPSDDGRSVDDGRPQGGHHQLDWLAQDHKAVSDALMDRGFVPVYPALVTVCGGIKPALMLGQAIGLSRTWLKHHQSRNGWFWMSAAEWQAATGLTTREQETARKSLFDAGLWEERRTHNPSRLYFRIQLAALAAALGLAAPVAAASAAPSAGQHHEAAAEPEARWQWSDAAANTLFGKADLFFKPLADLAGGVMPGLLLSQLLAMQRTAIQERTILADGRFVVRFEQLAASMQIGAKVMRNARDILRDKRLAVDVRDGAGPRARVLVSVDVVAMLTALKAQPATEMNKRVAAARQDKQRQRAVSGKSAVATTGGRIAAKRQSSPDVDPAQLPLLDGLEPAPVDGALLSIAELPIDAAPIAQAAIDGALLSNAKAAPVDNVPALLSIAEESWCRFRKSDGALLSNAYTENKYREPPPTCERTTPVDNFEGQRRRIFEDEPRAKSQPQAEAPQPASAQPAEPESVLTADGQPLVVPEGLDAAIALKLTAKAPPALRQVVLDELAGHLRSSHKAVSSPIGYLHSLVTKAAAGSLIAPLAAEVAQQRAAKAAAAAREAEALGRGAQATPVALAAPERDAAAVEAVRAKLKEARAQIIAAGAARSIGSGGQHDE